MGGQFDCLTGRNPAQRSLVKSSLTELESEIAEIQRQLLPSRLPSPEGYTFAAYYEPCRAAGGDYYGFREFSPDELGFAVGDVSGHGVKAAVMMAVLRAALAAHQVFGRNRKFVSQDLNQIVNAVGVPGVFVTAFFVSLELSSGEIYCGNCGHPPALIRRADGRVEPLVGGASLPIGMVEEIDAPLFIAQLHPGEALILFTDGITEARNVAGEFFDDTGLHEAIRQSEGVDAESMLQSITGALKQHTGEVSPSDDRCVLICARNQMLPRRGG